MSTRPRPHASASVSFIAVLLTCLMIVRTTTIKAQDDAGVQAHIQRIDAWIAQAEGEKNQEAVDCLRRDRATWVEFQQAIERSDAFRMLALSEAMKHPCPYPPPGQDHTVVAAPAQPEEQQEGPEIIGQVYSMPSEGEYLPLEREEGDRSSARGGFIGYYSSRTKSIRIEGVRSSVRYKQGQHRFVVKVWPGMDPFDLVKLYRFEVIEKKNERVVETSKSSRSRYHSYSTDNTEGRVRVSFKKLAGQGVYEIVHEEPVPPGEYAFLSGEKVFAFGVDE
ncbi:MAG TPA: hypothetical protein PKE53_03970 [Flavobacteriales bacterium]|nr:hypothetical protein [Flavobacteriales bacterium]MCC6656051.1 hypothetical protein [Flavobacteriales bacterium]HMU13135.1 hypothetical protein [Flavobacteriales bacterium]HMZ49268.1 hypothetical protein [Flavobacteriales bacterium]HNA32546.1 hypothetical protein [Flavobacteriales bacterium]